MELYKGLPIKTITAETLDGNEAIFGVTTDTVNDLITSYFNESIVEGEIEEFDNSYMYAVPQPIFESSRETILNYINEQIDNNYKL